MGVFIGDRVEVSNLQAGLPLPFRFVIFRLLLLFFGGDQVTDMLLRPRCRIMYSSGEGAGDAKLDKLLSFSKESSSSDTDSGDNTTGSSWSADRLRFGVAILEGGCGYTESTGHKKGWRDAQLLLFGGKM